MNILNIMSGPGRYLIGEEEKQEILDVLETGHLFRFGGESDPKYKHKVVSFEDELKMHLGSEYCLAVTGGSTGLLTSLAALGIGDSCHGHRRWALSPKHQKGISHDAHS